MSVTAVRSTCLRCGNTQRRPMEIEGDYLERCRHCDAYDWDPPALTQGVCTVTVAEDSPIARLMAQRVVLTITFQEAVSGEDVRRLARAWAARISEKQAVYDVHVQTHGPVAA